LDINRFGFVVPNGDSVCRRAINQDKFWAAHKRGDIADSIVLANIIRKGLLTTIVLLSGHVEAFESAWPWDFE
jgi:hypothetical protein